MFSKASALFFALGLGSAAFAQQNYADKVAALKLAATEVDRIKLLTDDEFVFDFVNPPGVGETNGVGGHTVAATPSNFPAIIGHGMAMTVGFLGPCGMNSPHTHPRATEFNFAVNGTLRAGMLSENGARFIINDVHPGSATIFPRGVIHFEMNDGCEPAMFVAAFNDEDPGVDQIAQRLFGLPVDILSATLGDLGVEQVAGLEAKIPDNVALGTNECLQRCGITRTQQPTNQRQPRVSGNALPAGFAGPSVAPASAQPTASIPQFSAPAMSTGGFVAQPGATHASGAAAVINDADGKPNPLVIALIVIVGLCLAGYIFLGVVFYRRSKRSQKSRSFGSSYFRTGSEFAPQGAMYESEKVFDASDRATPYDPPSPATPAAHK